MKKTILLFFVLATSLIHSQTNENNSDRFSDILSHSIQKNLSKNSTIPSFIQFTNGKEPQLHEITALLNTFSKTNFTLKEIKRENDQLGFTHIKYQQVVNGIPLEFSFLGVHIKDGKIVSVSGNLSSLEPNSSSSSVSEKKALSKALLQIGAKKYKWEIPVEEAYIKEDQDNPDATFFPSGELTYLETKNGLKLTYKFNIYAHEPLSRAEYYVDANLGKVLFENDIIHHANTTGIAHTGYSGTQTITTDSTSPTNYRLRETGRGNGIQTFDMNTGTNYGSAVDFIDSNNTWTSTTNGDQYALDAHWGAEMTYDYFWNVHARNSIDGSGFRLRSYVHYNSNYVNAFWDGSRMTYGDGNGTTTSPLTTMAIAGHEISHGLTSNTANLVYSYESGALNESFSDIFGVAIDFWSRPTLADWEMGDEIYISSSSYFRSMSNPNARNDPDTYLGTHWYTGTGDNGGVNTNSGVQNFWFYLLVNGGTGTNDNGDAYSVSALGLDTAARIAFRNLTVYLSRNSQYADARFYAIKSATDLYGACSPAVIATTNAWHAVGVGPAYVPGVISNFSTIDSVGCKLPHTVSFTNSSNNATAFIWDFGDGNTSTAVNPTHTYTSGFGPWNVTLRADGGTCGKDTIIKIANVRIDTTKACPIILAKNSTMSSTDCSGTLYDDGGATGDYDNLQNSYFTISPTSAVNITLNFTLFDVERGSTGSTCDYDYFEVYDGTNTSAPLLGRYCNNNPPPATLTSTGGDIFIKFHSDRYTEEQGFKIDWTCTQHTSPFPLALFTSSEISICENDTIKYNNTSYNATSYSWSFPGGSPSSSTLSNPEVNYSSSGSYTTRLIATNTSGSDTSFQTINVKKNCSIILNANSNSKKLACHGKVIDDGGLTSDYSPNQTTTFTIAPAGAVNVTLSFNTFDVEASGCIYDHMLIYDGPTTSSPLIGKYCNSSVPPSTISSSGNAITIKFYADPGLELSGFDIDWYCSLVGLTELDKIKKVSIFPNPSTNFVTIEADFNQHSEVNLKIIDLLGKTLYENKNTENVLQFTDRIDISGFASGTYIVYLNGQAHKFVKQ